MAWTEITQDQYDRRRLRCASDCRDEEWAMIAPFPPAPNRIWPTAEIAGAWDMGCDPVYCDDRLPIGDAAEELSALHHGSALFLLAARQRHARYHERNADHVDRRPAGRAAELTAGAIDSQGVKCPDGVTRGRFRRRAK